MSAAAARRRKQLQARKQQAEGGGGDAVLAKLHQLLEQTEDLDEATAYECLQLAQSQIRKKEHASEYADATELAYKSSLAILRSKRVSVASQLMMLLAEVLRETHTEETEEWLNRIAELDKAHKSAMKDLVADEVESVRLERLQRDFLRRCVKWSADLGKMRYGEMRLHEMLAEHCWTLSGMPVEDMEEQMDLQCDAVTHMALGEKPDRILEWLSKLPGPTKEQTRSGHMCYPALRDALFTRSLLCFCAIENLRDANILLKGYAEKVESRDLKEMSASYVNKEDGKAPSHVIFGVMLLRICEKDPRTGPLYTWLMKSFKRELDMLHKPQVVQSYSIKIGKLFFNIQPPPSMLSMMENMMGMMGGGGGFNPAMMQAALAQGGM